MFAHLFKFIRNPQCIAVGMMFLIMGALFGNWATLIPIIKTKFFLDDAQLGLIILCLPIGAAMANPISTWFIHRYGMQRMTLVAIAGMCIAYLLPVAAPWLWGVVIGLFVVGITIGFTNVSMNTCAAALEIQLKDHIMSTCHGLFSFGLMIGSLSASTMIGIGLVPFIQSAILSGSFFLMAWLVRRHILTIRDDIHEAESEAQIKFFLPKGPLLFMISIAMCTNLTEGSMADWSAVYLRDVVHSAPYLIGWGLASYSFFMAMGRFFGDYFIPRFGANRILKWGGILSALGVALAVAAPYTWICILAFGMVGLGVSCGAPILYGAAARLPNLAKGVGLATLNTYSVISFLGGPVIIGIISTAINLQVALALISFIALLWVYLSSKISL